MDGLSVLKSAINFTRNGVTVFSGIGSLIPGESRLLGSRVGIGFGTLAGIARVTTAAPGISPGTLFIEQSVDAQNWEVTNSFTLLPATGVLPFKAIVVGTYIRARYVVSVGEVHTLRFGATLRPGD